MSKAERDKKSDADVLRAKDMVPQYNKKNHQKQGSEKTETNKRKSTSSQSKRKQSSKNITSPAAGKKAERAKDLPAEPTDAAREGNEIPKFDLAEEIMAEQRRITAIRRKGPGQKSEAPSEEGEVELDSTSQEDGEMGGRSIGYTIEQPPPMLSEQEKIIAEIVARDIEKLCGGLDA